MFSARTKMALFLVQVEICDSGADDAQCAAIWPHFESDSAFEDLVSPYLLKLGNAPDGPQSLPN